MIDTLFTSALQAIDDAHATDPNLEIWEGEELPRELLYAQRMTGVLHKLYPFASETLQLACRSHHIYRWKIPRSDYPMNKEGYHQWRNTLKKYHADQAALILTQTGYTSDKINIVRSLIEKKNLKSNADTQALEDVICIVFLKYYIASFAPTQEESKMIEILKKTWKKMSELAQKEALKLEVSSEVKKLMEKALA